MVAVMAGVPAQWPQCVPSEAAGQVQLQCGGDAARSASSLAPFHAGLITPFVPFPHHPGAGMPALSLPGHGQSSQTPPGFSLAPLNLQI